MQNDEIPASGGTNGSENEQTNTAGQRLPTDTHGEITNENSTREQHTANSNPEISTPIYGWTVGLWREFTNWKHDPYRLKAHWSDLATIGLTVVIVIIGSLQACIYEQQKKIMESSGSQTDLLIRAANIQACAADRNAAAAERFSASADRIRDETSQAVTQLGRAASDTEATMKENALNAKNALNASIEANKLDQRAWFGISDFKVLQYDPDDPKKPFRIEILFRNTGKTPARQVHALGMFQVYKPGTDGPSDSDWKAFMGFFDQSKERYVTAPNATRKYIVTDSNNGIITQNYPVIKGHSLYAYYFGLVTYIDINDGPRSTKFCLLLAEPETKQLAHCGRGNDMN